VSGDQPATSAVTGRRANQLRYGASLLKAAGHEGQPGNYNVPAGPA